MTRTPAVRVSNARLFLEFLTGHHPALHAHVRATLPTELTDLLADAAETDW